MKQVRAVEAKSLAEFAEALNETYAELSRFTVERTELLSDRSVLIFYDIPDELMLPEEPEEPAGPKPDYIIEFDDSELDDQTVTIRLKVNANVNHHCCECDNYDWGRGCPYRDGHIRIMDPACNMFNIVIERH